MASLSDFSSSYPNLASQETIFHRTLENFSSVVQNTPETHNNQANSLADKFLLDY